MTSSGAFHRVLSSGRTCKGGIRFLWPSCFRRPMHCVALFAKTKIAARLRPIGTTGKSLLIYRNRVKPQNQKYFAFPEGQIRGTSIAIPSREEGRIMIATIVGRVAVDAGSADSERHESVRQRRVGLTSRCWRQCPCRQHLLERI